MSFNYETKFLWLPKKIDGKWYWLRKVSVETKTTLMNIGGKFVQVETNKYIVKGV